MTRIAALPLVALLLSVAAAAAPNPDPAALAPSPADVSRARELVARLGSGRFSERDAATRALFRMGRAAQPALAEAARAADPEVRTRAELLMPRIEAADLKARLAAFRADADGKYAHELPAWDRFRAVTGNTADARDLFAQMLESPATAELLQALARGTPADVGRQLAGRRAELYLTLYGNRRGTPPTLADTAALVFLEGLRIDGGGDRRYTFVATSLMSQPGFREAVRSETKSAARKLVVRWLDTREDATELQSALSLAVNLGVKDAPPAKYAVRMLDGPARNGQPYLRMIAFAAIARSGDRQYLPLLAKSFADETSYTVFWNGNERHQIQVRDVALAMSVLLVGGDPAEYGFEVRTKGAADAIKYSYIQYRLADDAKRAAAFKKWDALQAKPPAEPKK
jgi:hypothetical protein